MISRLIVFDKEVERPAPPPRRDAKFYILHFQFYILTLLNFSDFDCEDWRARN